MQMLEGENMLWQDKDKNLMLTTHRLRYEEKSIWGSTIKSMMLEELTSCELRTIFRWDLIRKAIIWFIVINGSVYLMNKFLFNSKLMIFLFGEVDISLLWVRVIFYLSILVVVLFVVNFFMGIKKMFSFHATGMTIDIQMRWLDFSERESFISQVEGAKMKRMDTVARSASQ